MNLKQHGLSFKIKKPKYKTPFHTYQNLFCLANIYFSSEL